MRAWVLGAVLAWASLLSCTTRGGARQFEDDPYLELEALLAQLQGAWTKQAEGEAEIKRILARGVVFVNRHRNLFLSDALHGTPDHRALAIPALGLADGDWSLPVLVRLLGDPDPDIRRKVIGALAYLQHRRIVPKERLPTQAIRKSLRDPEAQVATAAAFFFSTDPTYRNDESLVRAIERLLRSPSWEARNQAARTLTIFRRKDSARALVAALRDRHPMVRSNAAVGVAVILEGRALPHLLPLLNDPDALVVRDVAALITRIAPRGIEYECPEDGTRAPDEGPCSVCGKPRIPVPRN